MNLLDDKNVYYLGNQKLKKVNVPVNFTKKQIMEFGKCANDPIYFIKKYVKIVNPNKGLTSFGLWPFQEKMAEMFVENRFTVCKIPRQSGKTQTVVAVLLWYVLFHQNYTIAVLAHKASQSREILSRLQFSYEHLPKWLQQGIVEWSKGTVILENGSKIETSATSGNSVRGKTYNCVTGDSIVTIKLNNVIFDIPIAQLNNIIRLENDTNNDVLWDNINEFHRKQIYKFILENYRKKNTESFREIEGQKIYDRGTSYNSYMYGWGKYKNKFNKSYPEGTCNITSPTTENGREDRQHLLSINISLYKNGDRTTRQISKIIKSTEGNLHRRIIEIAIETYEWEKTVRIHKKKNFHSCNGKNDVRRIYIEDVTGIEGKGSRNSKNGRTQEKDFYSEQREKEIYRNSIAGQQKSGKDSKNGRETSWNETVGGISFKNEYKRKITMPETERIEILTRDGFKEFDGIRKVGLRKIIEIVLTCGRRIKCTPDHKILTDKGWVEAQYCFSENISTLYGYSRVKYISETEDGVVYDILHVKDNNEFLCNEINVHNCVYLDEFAFVPNNIQTEFFATVMPTISAGEETKMIITSTPNGMNMFHKIWNEAVAGENSFKPIGVHWSEIPGRDEKWKEETIKNSSILQFNQEFGCEFLGSQNTLISAAKLEQMYSAKPVRENQDMKIYIDPSKKEHRGKLFIMVVDTSRGIGGDYNAFVIFDVSEIPYKVVGQYKNNTISPLMFPNIIHQFAKSFNDAYICVEINDNGQQVADILYREMEYENMVFSYMRGNMGQQLSSGFGGRPTVGIRTTKLVKRIGCTNFKTLVENDKLLIPDIDIKKELYNFIEVGESFEAAEGHHDDLSMCCVLFSWLVQQPYFKDWTDTNVRERMVSDNLKLLDEDVLPIYVEDNINYDMSEIRDVSHNEFVRFLMED